ncbi:MAG: DUF1501 domain-containing protein [Acidobacteria bacterium]|nr:DUF1501 domain-containing protein [Acidobacteriota bacterium]
MFRFDAEKTVSFCGGIRRRDFLHAGALSVLGLSLPDLFAIKAQGADGTDHDMNCIFLMLLGGPSQVDTFDLKPSAPAEIRGPFKPIKTNVPGIEISELFPHTAKHADKFALVRSVHHTAAAVHDTGHQLMQTGRLFQAEEEHPHIGSVISKLHGLRGDMPSHVLLPQPIGNTGGNLPHGQTAGFLGKEFDPFVPPPDCISSLQLNPRRNLRAMVDASIKQFEAAPNSQLLDDKFHQAYTLMSSAKMREAFDLSKEADAIKDRYGRNKFGLSCLLARRMIERGVRFVTINQFETVFNEITWDSHGSAPFSPIASYRDEAGPMFDNAYSSLLEDLHQRGLLKNTLVVATGEFGRTPQINPAGGRDHWPQCWTMLFAGGGVKGGQVIGSSDEIGAYPKDRPVTPAEVTATIMHSLKIDPKVELTGPLGCPIRVVEPGVQPISELF